MFKLKRFNFKSKHVKNYMEEKKEKVSNPIYYCLGNFQENIVITDKSNKNLIMKLLFLSHT